MTKHVDPSRMTKAQLAAEFITLRGEFAALKELLQKHAAPQLTTFVRTLAAVIESELSHLNEPVFENPATGRKSSSLFAVMLALDYDNKDNWSVVCRKVKGLPGVFPRTDLPKQSSWPTQCVELEAVAEVLAAIRPTKARLVLTAFKEKHGVS